MNLKSSLLFLELKQKFMMKWKYCNLKKTKEFLEMQISYNCKNQKILDRVLAYFNIVTNLTSTPLPLGYVFKSNDKQYSLSSC